MYDNRRKIGFLTTIVLMLTNMVLMLTLGKGYEIAGTIIAAVFLLIEIGGIIYLLCDMEPGSATLSGILGAFSVAFYIPYKLAMNNKITHDVFDWQLGFCLFFMTLSICIFLYCFYRDYNGRFSGEQYKLFPLCTIPAFVILNVLFFAGKTDMRIAYAIVVIGNVIILSCSAYFAWRDMQRKFTIAPAVMLLIIIGTSFFAFQQPVPEHEHIYVSEVITVSTCVKEGELKYSCIDCENSYIEPMAVIEHEYKEASRTASTCITEGVVTFVCSACNANYSEPLPLVEHTLVETARTESTCAAPGNVTYACQVCGVVGNETLPLTNEHSYKMASYAEGGFFKTGRENYVCEHCGDKYASVLIKYDIVKIAIGIIVLSIAIFIIKMIVDDEYRWSGVLGRPGFWIGSFLLVIALFYIVSYLVIEFAPEKGAIWYDKMLVRDYNEDEHIVGEISRVESTCTVEGKIVLGCQVCDDTYEEIIPLKEHVNVETARTNATCTAKGSVAYTCSVCGYSHTEEIEMLPHNNVEEVIEPTCSVHGAHKYTCSVCGQSQNEKIPVLEHNNVEQSRTEGSFWKRGQVTYKCELCGEESTEKLVKYPGWKLIILAVVLVVDAIAIVIFQDIFYGSKRRMLTSIGLFLGGVAFAFCIYYIWILWIA